MNWPSNPYVLPAFLGAMVAALLAVFIWRRHPAPGAKSSAIVMLTVTLWCLGYTFELASPDLPGRIFWSKVEYFGIVTTPLAWFAFALEYTGHGRFLSRRNLALLAIVPLLTLALVWTNESHWLFWSRFELDTRLGFVMSAPTRTIGFYINWIFAYVLLASSTLLLLRWQLRSPSLYRKQAAALLLATLMPWVGNFLFISGTSPFPRLDLTPLSFTVSGAALAWGLFRYRLLDIVPVARDTVVEKLQDAVIVLDAQNRIVDANPSAQAILGCKTEDAIGKPAARVLSTYPDLVQQLQDVSVTHAEISLGMGQTQRYFDLDISAFKGQHQERPGGRILVLRDVTARQRAEEAVRQLNDELEQRVAERTAQLVNANEALQQSIVERQLAEIELDRQNRRVEALSTMGQSVLASLDLDTVLTAVVQQASHMLEARGVSLLLRENDELVFAALNAENVQSLRGMRMPVNAGIAGQVMQIGRAILARGAQLAQSSDTEITQMTSVTAQSIVAVPLILGHETVGVIEAVDPQPIGFDHSDVGILVGAANWAAIAIRNARQHAEIRRRLQETEAMAMQNANLYQKLDRALQQEQATRSQLVQTDKLAAMGRMVASVAHELNNPLQAIKNCLFLIQQNLAPESQDADILEMAVGEVQRLADLVARLRAVYRPSLAAEMRLLKLVPILEEVALLAAPHLGKNKIAWQFHPPATSPNVNGFADQLKQVFLNLSLNAVDAMRAAGGSLCVNLLPSEDGKHIGVEFRDTGAGICPEDLLHVFEPFFTTKETGMGLGLAISHDIVQRHNGRVTVESQVGRGTTFTVWLPVAVNGEL